MKRYILIVCFTFISILIFAQSASIYFDGNGDYASIGANRLNTGMNGATGITFEAWINPTSLRSGSPADAYRNLIMDFCVQGSNSMVSMYIRENGKIRFGGRSSATDSFQDVITATPVITTNAWYHIAGVLDFTGKKIFLYINGELKASRTTGVAFGRNTFSSGSGGNEYIGAGALLNPNYYFHGYMDDIRLWSTPRSLSDILANKDKPISPQINLLAYWKFDNTSQDSSGNGYHASLISNTEYGTPYIQFLYLYIEPDYSQVYEDDYVDLNVKIEGLEENLRAYEVKLSFDPAFLLIEDYASFTESTFLSDHGLTQFFVTGNDGNYEVTCALLGVNSGVTGAGTLFTIRLKALNATGENGTNVNILSSVLRSPMNQDIECDDMLGATVEIIERPMRSQFIPLHTGWNLISSWIQPENANLHSVFADLISDGCLIKVQDEAAYSFVYDDNEGWLNSIGDFDNLEGYYVQVNQDCVLELSGYDVQLPLVVPLHSGWNIIPYPYIDPENAMDVLQSLIDAYVFEKAQDESAASIVNDNGNWVDSIGEFESGEGYYVKVNADTELIFNSRVTIESTINSVSNTVPLNERKYEQMVNN